MDILVNVVNQELKIATNLKNYVEGTQEFIRFVFNLTGDWKDLTVFAQFTQDDASYNVYLDDHDSVYLPSEIKAGICTMVLYGSNAYTVATTDYVTLTIDESILVIDAQGPVVTKSLYDQLVERIEQFEDAITYARFG